LGEEPGRAIATRSAALPGPAAEVLAGMAAVWTVSERSGAPAAEMILRYASAQRDALDAERERRIAMAGPKSTVRVLSWLPLIGSAGHRPARAAEPRWGCGPLRTRALVDEDDDAAGAAVIVMLPVLIAAFVAIGVLLWSDTPQSRLQGLLGRPVTGPAPEQTT